MDARERILAALPADPPPDRGFETPRPELAYADRAAMEAAFWERFAWAGGRRAESADIDRLLSLTAWVEPAALPFVGNRKAADARADSVWTAKVGVTVAIAAVAETGSLLFAAGPGCSRLASLAPPIHLAIVPAEAVVATLDEAIGMLGSRTCVLVTGPSRTADIEGVLVRGVHGPGELWAWPTDTPL